MKEAKQTLEEIKAESAANPNHKRALACANVLLVFIGELRHTGAIKISNEGLIKIGMKCLPFKLRSAMDQVDSELREDISKAQRRDSALAVASAVVQAPETPVASVIVPVPFQPVSYDCATCDNNGTEDGCTDCGKFEDLTPEQIEAEYKANGMVFVPIETLQKAMDKASPEVASAVAIALMG